MPPDAAEDMPVPRLSDRYAHAFAMALRVHRDQARKGGHIPYLAHVMAVSSLALENGADEEVAIAALLHDTVEDSEDGAAIRNEVEHKFGARVAGIVEACSDRIPVPGQRKPEWLPRKKRYLDHLEQVDDSALLVSLSDKLHNARAILADYKTEGPALWPRFNSQDPQQHLWYYGKLAEIFQRRRPGALSDELGGVVRELTDLVAEEPSQ